MSAIFPIYFTNPTASIPLLLALRSQRKGKMHQRFGILWDLQRSRQISAHESFSLLGRREKKRQKWGFAGQGSGLEKYVLVMLDFRYPSAKTTPMLLQGIRRFMFANQIRPSYSFACSPPFLLFLLQAHHSRDPDSAHSSSLRSVLRLSLRCLRFPS